MKCNMKYTFMLVFTALIWGMAFVAQSAGMEHVGPFTFNGIRSIIGALVLAPSAWFMDKKEGVLTPWKDKTLVLGGLICGVVLFLATSSPHPRARQVSLRLYIWCLCQFSQLP